MFWIDYLDNQRREFPGGKRFMLFMADGYREFGNVWVETDCWDDVRNAVPYVRYVGRLGIGFRVDARGRDYVETVGFSEQRRACVHGRGGRGV
jgi:hypothetical protein